MSLRTKVVGITVAITTASLALVAVIGVIQIRQQISAEQHRAADSMALGFARASELAIAVRDTRELSRLAGSFLRDENVLFIAAYAGGHQPIASAIRDREAWSNFQQGRIDGNRCAIAERVIEASSQPDEFGLEGAGDPLDPAGVNAAAPGAHTSARPAPNTTSKSGRVVIGLSTAPALLAQRHQSQVTVAATGGAALVGAIVLFFTLGRWMRRLQRLAEASQSMSRGDFTGAISDRRDDEIGKLAATFDSMRIALHERDLKLREFTDTLQEQVKQRTHDLELALATAEEANRAKSLFLASMSHELRTPLNGVIGMVDLLLGTNPNPQQARYCEVAKSSARALLDLINDILDFSKIEAGKLELEAADFNLHETIENVVQMLGDRAEKKKIELACGMGQGVPQFANGDAVRLRQVLVNLVSNALKFTERGEVVVGAELQNQTDECAIVKFTVRDSGIGIPRDRLDRLFKSFSQVDTSTTRKFGGTGLGLAISQRIVELMGGTIGVESEEGKGSTFWFTARLGQRKNMQLSGRDSRVDPRGLRALIVDDSHINREILQAQLKSWALNPDAADSALRAMEMLRGAAQSGQPYRFAILDMHMPNVDGMQLARQIKSDPTTRDVILISLSSLSDQMRPAAMGRLGFSACLTKPALPSQLYNAIIDSLAATDSVVAHALALAAEQAIDQLSSQPAVQPSDQPLDPPLALPEYLPAPEVQAPQLPGVRVLLAEDNEINRLVASELLQQTGCLCTIVVNGREAVEEALRNPHDVILMDCQMPEMDGFEATRAIRDAESKDPLRPHRAIIALTANAIKGDREQCLAQGMDGYVTKPIDPIELIQTIRLFLPAERSGGVKPTLDRQVQASIPPAPADPAGGPPVDVVSLQQRCLGNRKIAAKALSKFDSIMSVDVRSLTDSVQRGDAKAVAASAHKIKGAAANVSAGALRRIAADLEALARADELAQTQSAIEQLHHEMERFRQYLSTALSQLAPSEKGPSPSQESDTSQGSARQS
jgi:signal transduction histidine kinase/DNA-binding response OmpR family regulator